MLLKRLVKEFRIGRKQFVTILLIIGAAAIARGQEVKITGQVRERSEIDVRSLRVGTKPDAFHFLRTRLGVTAAINAQTSVVAEVQDARTFGATRSTLNAGSPALDLRLGYMEVRDIADAPVAVRLGRQTLSYANERLLGQADWSNLGRSFDAIMGRIGRDEATIDLIGAALARNIGARDGFLTGAWGRWKPSELGMSVQGYYLFDTPSQDSVRQNRHTTGVYSQGTFSGMDYEIDGAMQFGDYRIGGEAAQERSISASMVGVRAGYTFTELAGLRIGAGYDRLSGIDAKSTDSYGAFSTLYGTNHKFYGHIDLLDEVASRRELGLQDIFAQLSIAPNEKTKVTADLHMLSTASEPPVESKSRQIGLELDLNASYRFSGTIAMSAGYAVLDGDRDRYLLQGRKTMSWGYLSLSAGF